MELYTPLFNYTLRRAGQSSSATASEVGADQGLRSRGDLTIWFSEDAIKAWQEPARGKPGGQQIYTNLAIKTALTIRMVYRFPLRQTELPVQLGIPGVLPVSESSISP